MSRKRYRGSDDPRWSSHIAPAPGELRVVQALVNTAGPAGEELSSPRALTGWLRSWDLLDRKAELGVDDLERLRQTRSGLRSLILANHGSVSAPEAAESLDRVAATVPIHFSFAGVARCEPLSAGVAAPLARLLEIAFIAHHQGHWQRLKLCAREDCGEAYYDFSNGRSAKWCSARCGDKGSSKTYRQRRKRYKARQLRDRSPALGSGH